MQTSVYFFGTEELQDRVGQKTLSTGMFISTQDISEYVYHGLQRKMMRQCKWFL